MKDFRIGVDIGGTFTDIVLMDDDGTVLTKKISSSVDNYATAIVNGLSEIFQLHGLTGTNVQEILHGTTVASNAILEHKGAKTGLIATKGFRDILEIRNLRMPRLYDLHWEKPPPLMERYLRQVVDERVSSKGDVVRQLDRNEAEAVVDRLLNEGVEVIAVSLINSFANPAHEQLIKEIIAERAPSIPVCISFDVLPEIKEYERTSTTVINAYLLPIVANYLASLEEQFTEAAIKAPLLLMQSNGGLTTAEAARRLPCNIVESGPAGGVVGGHAFGRKAGLNDIITFDMGGTTAKASLIENGEYTRSLEFQVGGGILTGSRLMTGAGYLLKVPAIDLAEVGAGGGSIISIDAGGSMQIGPQSAGADPGPVCYNIGGTEPTITDANVVLGYLNQEHLVGGELKIDSELSRAILSKKIAAPLGLTVEHAAYGAHQIAISNMIRAIRAVSSERGRDPRQYAMVPFGGNGPLFAAGMAQELRMGRIIVPPAPGLFSSFGLLYADVEHHYSRTVQRVVREMNPSELTKVWNILEEQARTQLTKDGFTLTQMQFRRAANMHYKGQIFELTVSAPDGDFDKQKISYLEEAFGSEHERTYGHRAGPEEPVELVNAQLIGMGLPDKSRIPERLSFDRKGSQGELPSRNAYFGPEHGWQETRVLHRTDLSSVQNGPCIVEEYDATCLIPPGARATLDDDGNIIIDL
ncbi:MAG: Acetophenone carboxylase gamma subunit [Alphaproteobacteria bacterium MarineAlpha4_Bin2]|nr:MAG: Acetophenone carboxylase gamma subunit [Alphaproteobacteria bacterium MarineAlpha4_Bin2]